MSVCSWLYQPDSSAQTLITDSNVTVIDSLTAINTACKFTYFNSVNKMKTEITFTMKI